MNRIAVIVTWSALTPMLTGCFSIGTSMVGSGASTRTATRSDIVAAAAADLVTLPIQPLIVAAIPAIQERRSASTRKRQLEEIRKNPEQLFTNVGEYQDWRVVLEAAKDSTIHFTDAQLRKLAAMGGAVKFAVVANERCPRDVLEAVWADRARWYDSDRSAIVASLAANPNVPNSWLEEIASRPEYYFRGSALAKTSLERRRVRATPR